MSKRIGENIFDKPIGLHEIRECVGGNLDVGSVCSSTNVNPFSRHKPISYNKIGEMTDDDFKAANFGFTPWYTTDINGTNPATNKSKLVSLYREATQYHLNGWTYAKPTGGGSSPYRLLDFDGYNHDEDAMLYPFDLAETTTVLSGEMSIQVVFKLNDNQTGIRYSEMEGNVYGTTKVYQMYLGVLIYDGHEWYIQTKDADCPVSAMSGEDYRMDVKVGDLSQVNPVYMYPIFSREPSKLQNSQQVGRITLANHITWNGQGSVVIASVCGAKELKTMLVDDISRLPQWFDSSDTNTRLECEADNPLIANFYAIPIKGNATAANEKIDDWQNFEFIAVGFTFAQEQYKFQFNPNTLQQNDWSSFSTAWTNASAYDPTPYGFVYKLHWTDSTKEAVLAGKETSFSLEAPDLDWGEFWDDTFNGCDGVLILMKSTFHSNTIFKYQIIYN